jgi:hypothetical protein
MVKVEARGIMYFIRMLGYNDAKEKILKYRIFVIRKK